MSFWVKRGVLLKKIKIAAVAVVLLIAFAGFATFATGGTAADPLVTLSYLVDTWWEDITEDIDEQVDTTEQQVLENADADLAVLDTDTTARLDQVLADAVTARVAERVAERGVSGVQSQGTEISLVKGEQVVGVPGAGVILKSGEGVIAGPAGSVVVNITTGSTRDPGFKIATGIYYMIVANDGSGIEITSDTATAIVLDGGRVPGRYAPQYTAYAEALRSLGLFLGSDKGFELERAPTRHESVIMLIRLLGEEAAALSYDGPTKFVDLLPGWEDGTRYIKYAEYMGYSYGVTENTFGQTREIDIHSMLTLILRSLGYDDINDDDFAWGSTDLTLAVQIGLLTQADYDEIIESGFRRDHIVLLSYNALSTKMKNSENLLSDRLIAQGVITEDGLDQAFEIAGE